MAELPKKIVFAFTSGVNFLEKHFYFFFNFIRNICVLQRTTYNIVCGTITRKVRVSSVFFLWLKGELSPQNSPSSPFSPIAPPQNNLLHGGPKKSYKYC